MHPEQNPLHPDPARPDPLRQELRRYAAGIAATHAAPPASIVWLRAERRSRRLAIERAERPLRIMQVLGLVCAVFAAAWMLRQSGGLRALPGGLRALPGGPHLLPAMGPTMVILAIATTILVIAGCWTMMSASRRLSS